MVCAWRRHSWCAVCCASRRGLWKARGNEGREKKRGGGEGGGIFDRSVRFGGVLGSLNRPYLLTYMYEKKRDASLDLNLIAEHQLSWLGAVYWDGWDMDIIMKIYYSYREYYNLKRDEIFPGKIKIQIYYICKNKDLLRSQRSREAQGHDLPVRLSKPVVCGIRQRRGNSHQSRSEVTHPTTSADRGITCPTYGIDQYLERTQHHLLHPSHIEPASPDLLAANPKPLKYSRDFIFLATDWLDRRIYPTPSPLWKEEMASSALLALILDFTYRARGCRHLTGAQLLDGKADLCIYVSHWGMHVPCRVGMSVGGVRRRGRSLTVSPPPLCLGDVM